MSDDPDIPTVVPDPYTVLCALEWRMDRDHPHTREDGCPVRLVAIDHPGARPEQRVVERALLEQFTLTAPTAGPGLVYLSGKTADAIGARALVTLIGDQDTITDEEAERVRLAVASAAAWELARIAGDRRGGAR